jgi:putative intracellular protease/amidase
VADVSYQDVDCAEFESNAAKMDLCRNTLPLKYFSGQGFDCILLIGGPGAMYDFHQSSDLARVITECYEHGTICCYGRTMVCHLSSVFYFIAHNCPCMCAL